MWKYREIASNLLPFCLVFLVTRVSSLAEEEELTLQVNTRKPISVNGDKFLSLTIDPDVILASNNVSENYERTIRLAGALSPAYLRLGGPRSNVYLVGDHDDKSYQFSEENWIRLHRWATRTGLDVIACISARFMEKDNKVDPISLTDRMGFNVSWQLGYECQTRCDLAGGDVGKYVRILRDKLNVVPRYSSSVIVGPDVVAYGTKEQREYLENFFSESNDALTAVTWHPDFAGVTRHDEGGIFLHQDRLSSEKNDFYRAIGRDAAKRPLWIAESRPEASKKQFLGALLWTCRLGNAAKLGAQVLMRQPSDLAEPTPDYWVSLLHKRLVGREVFDAKIQTGDRSHVHFYAHCTKPSAIYERGALTIFGVNLTPRKIRVGLKGLKSRTLDEYLLMPGFDAPNRMFAESVHLNGKPLNLINDTELPDIEAVTLNDEKGLSIELASGGIGFWVVPDQKIKSCMDHWDSKDDNEDTTENDPVDQRISQKDENESVRENEIRGKKRSMDHQKSAARQENRRRKSTEKRDDEIGERKLRKIDAQKELEKLGKILKRRFARRESKKSASGGGSLDLFDFDPKREVADGNNKLEEQRTRSRRDLERFFVESPRTDRKHKRKDDGRRNEQPWTMLSPRKVDNEENSFYGFFRQEPIKNFPEGDVFLATGNSKEEEEKDYDYVKDEDEIKKENEEEEKNTKPQAIRIRTIDHAEPDDTWIDVGDDYRGYMPNEFFETINVPNNGERKEGVNDYGDIWEAETVPTRLENEKKDNANDGRSSEEENESSIGEGIRGNSVNMLMSRCQDSRQLDEDNQENLGKSRRTKSYGPRESVLASFPDKTKLTFHGKRRSKTIPEEDEPFSTSMYIPNGDSFKHGRRFRRSLEDLNAVLERAMIEEDNGNTRDCRCRVIRNDVAGSSYVRKRRNVDENERDERDDVEYREGDEKPADDTVESIERGIEGEGTETLAMRDEESSGVLEENERDEGFFRGERGPAEETGTTIDPDEDHNGSATRIPQDTTPKSEESFTTTRLPDVVALQRKGETVEIASGESSGTSSSDARGTTEAAKGIDEKEFKSPLKREISLNGVIKKRVDVSTQGTSKGTRKFLPKSANASRTRKIESNSREAERQPRVSESGLTSRKEAPSVVRKENENRRRNLEGSISIDKDREHIRERTEKLVSLRRRLLAKREEILRQFENELLEAMKRSGIEEKEEEEEEEEERRRRNRKNRRNLKREIWEKLRTTGEYRDMLDREKVAYVLTYGPINYDIFERERKRKEKEEEEEEEDEEEEERKPSRNERKYVPFVEITRPVYKVEEKLIEEPTMARRRYLQDPRVMLYAKSDGSNSRVIQSRFPYDIIGERERYDSDRVASGKRYYALVDSAEEDPWMFQYQRRSKEDQRNVYESDGRRKHLDDSTLNYGTPMRYIYEDFEESISSEESSNSRSTNRKIYAIDPSTYKGGEPELEVHEDSTETTNENEDESKDNNESSKEIYGVVMKEKLDDNSKKNAPILYILDAKRQNDKKKQSNVVRYLLDRRHVTDDVDEESNGEDKSPVLEDDVKKVVDKLETNEATEISQNSSQKLEDMERASEVDLDEEKKKIGSRRKRRDIAERDFGFLNKIPLFFVRKGSYDENRNMRSIPNDYFVLNNEIRSPRQSKFNKYPKLVRKQVYAYSGENNDKKWKDLDDLQFKKSSSLKEGNYVDDISEDFKKDDPVIKTNDRKGEQVGNDKSPSFLQGALPKLQEVITEGFDKAQNLTGSLEQFVESFDKKFNATQRTDEGEDGQSRKVASTTSQDIFRAAVVNVKKFFAFLSGVTHVFQA